MPETCLTKSAAGALRQQLRAVMKEAMKQTGQPVQSAALGLRIHAQHKMPETWTEEAIASARQGHIVPQVSTMHIGRIVAGALKGVLFGVEGQVLQMLVTSSWGDTDAIQLTAWELDLGRREGVQ